MVCTKSVQRELHEWLFTTQNRAIAARQKEEPVCDGPLPDLFSMRVAIDLPADAILIPIQRPLIGMGKMTVVETSIEPLAGTHHMIFAMQIVCLMRVDTAFGESAMDAPVLMGKAMVDLDAMRMGLRP